MNTALQRELEAAVDGEVRFDTVSRALYSTDASVYQIEPLGVVIPRSAEAVARAVDVAARHEVPITPRGGGTSQAGQSIGAGLVLDTSKHLNRVLEINPDERWARVEPGVVLDDLNAMLRPHHLRFAPDVSSASRATVGGMMANNSSGARSVLYGKTIDHVREQHVVLSDGAARAIPAARTPEQLASGTEQATASRRARIAPSPSLPSGMRRRSIAAFRRCCAASAATTSMSSSIPRRPVDLTKILIGSEGTLGFIVEATIGLVPLPAAKAVLTIEFDELLDALGATPLVLKHRPSAVEVMDDFILRHAKQNPALEAQRRSMISEDGSSLLCVEFYGDRQDELVGRLEALERDLKSAGLRCRCRQVTDAAAQQRIWSFREAALGLSTAMKGDGKAISFVEDTAVAPEKLRDYISRFVAIVKRHHTIAGVYAHASVGCLHVRPVINLKTADGVGEVRSDRQRGRRPGAGVRRRAVGRARRRPGARRVQRKDVRHRALRGVPASEGDVRSAAAVQSRPHRRHAADYLAPAVRRGLRDAGSGDVLRFLRARRVRARRGNVQRRRPVPQEARGHDVPVVHGHAGRSAFDARPRQRAADGHGRAAW